MEHNRPSVWICGGAIQSINKVCSAQNYAGLYDQTCTARWVTIASKGKAKVSKGRPQSPLVASTEAKSLKIMKHHLAGFRAAARPGGFAVVPRPQSARLKPLVSVDSFSALFVATGDERFSHPWTPSRPLTDEVGLYCILNNKLMGESARRRSAEGDSFPRQE